MTFCTKSICKHTILLLLLFFIGSNLNAQNGQFDVRTTVKNVDCTNNKVTIEVQIKAHDAQHTFLMGDANYRFDYEHNVINNPVIVSQDNFSNQSPANDGNYAAQNISTAVLDLTLSTVSLNTNYGGGGFGAKLVGTDWITVSTLQFDVQDATKCIVLFWHDDSRSPITGMNEIVLTQPTPDGNFSQFIVISGGVFDNLNICLPTVCSNVQAIDDINVTKTNTSVNGSAATNDASNGGVMTFTAIGSGTEGLWSVQSNGSYSFAPTTNFRGTAIQIYKVCNTAGQCDTAVIYIKVTDEPALSGQNIAPIALNDNAQTLLNIAVVGNALNNDFDPDAHALTLTTTPILNPKNGGVTLNANGNFTYIPNNNFIGQDTFQYRICDNGTPNLCDTATVIITVSVDNNATANDRPNAQDDAAAGYKGATITASLAANDSDPNGNTWTYNTLLPNGGSPVNGSVTINANGSFTYTPTSSTFTGSDKFQYVVCDNGTPSLCDTATVYIMVYPRPNDAPVITVTPQTTPEDAPQTFCVTYSDPNDGDTHTATLCGAQVGTVSTPTALNGRLCFTYTPFLDYNGQDTVCIILCDQRGACVTAYIPITITPVPDAPTATNPLPATIAEDSTINVCTTINDVDTPNGPFLFVNCSTEDGGIVTPSVNGNELCINYIPTLNFNGIDTICVTVCDQSGLCFTINHVIIITSKPDVPSVTKTPFVTAEDTPVQICQTITDPDAGDTFTATLCSQPTHGTAQTVVVNGNQVCVMYSPALNYNGQDTVCLIVCDQTGLCDTAKIPLSITPVNDKPVLTFTPKSFKEDLTVTICATITDPDLGDTHTTTLCSQPLHGTAGTPSFSDNQVCVTYSPSLNYNGLDTLCLIVCDQSGACDTAKIPLSITPVNDAPVVSKTPVTTAEDTPIQICQTITDPDAGDTFTATLLSQPLHGTTQTAIINGNQVCVMYSPSLNYNGQDTLQLIVCDQTSLCDTVKIPITITGVNDKPIITVTPTTLLEDATVRICSNIIDPDLGDTFTATLCSQPAHGVAQSLAIIENQVCVTYSPTANYNGLDTICLIVCDNNGLCDTAKIPLSITPVNDKPTITRNPVIAVEDSSVAFCQSIIDPDLGDIFTASLLTPPLNGSASTPIVNGNQVCMSYMPNINYFGQDTICVLVCDQTGLCDTAKIAVTVTPVPDPPRIVKNLPTTFPEDSTFTICTTVSDPDTPEGPFTVSNCSTPFGGMVTPSVLNNQLCINYLPIPNYFGKDTICLIVCDNTGLCDTLKHIITITSVNDAPAVRDSSATTTPSVSVTKCLPIIDPDVTDTHFAFTLQNVIHGTVEAPISNRNLCITYTPSSTYVGLDSVSFLVCDTGNPMLCDTVTMRYEVKTTNSPPKATNDINYTLEGIQTSGNFLTNDSDLNAGQTLTTSVLVQPKHAASFTLNANGSYTYTSTLGFIGKDTMRYKVCDNGVPVMCDSAVLIINVRPAASEGNQRPLAIDDITSTPSGQAITIFVKANDTDPNPNDILGLPNIILQPSCGTTVVNQNGTVTYTPTAGFMGVCTMLYSVCDNGSPSLCDTAAIQVTVYQNPFVNNQTPNAVDDAVRVVVNTEINATVATNDSDPDAGQVLSFMSISTPLHGTMTMQTNGNFRYTPTTSFVGRDSFRYKVCDNGSPVLCDTATVYLTIANPIVTPTNIAPIANPDNPVTIKNIAITIRVKVNDYDPNGDPLSMPTITVAPTCGTATVNSNGTIGFVPNTGFVGTCTFIYQICDTGHEPSLCDTALVTIKVLATPIPNNRPPTALNDAFITNANQPLNNVSVSFNDSDPDVGQTLTFTAISQPTKGFLSFNSSVGTFTYLPQVNFIGMDSFRYKVCDNGTPSLCDTAMVYINYINAPTQNLAPIAMDDIIEISSNRPINIPVLANDKDPNGTPLSNPTILTQPTCGTTSINEGGAIFFAPNTDFVGTCSFTYQVCDNDSPNLCDTATVTVIVYPTVYPNKAPIAQNDATTTTMNTAVGGNVSLNDNDLDAGQTLSFSKTTNPTRGTAVLQSNGLYVYTPQTSFVGRDSFPYQACDNGSPSLCATAWVFIEVTQTGVNINEKPVATKDKVRVVTGVHINMPVKLNDYDPNPNQTLSNPIIVTAPTCGTASVNEDGTIGFTSNNGFVGTCTMTYSICDNGSPVFCDTTTVTIIVSETPVLNDINLPPVALDDANSNYVNITQTGNVGNNDSDPNQGQTLSFALINVPNHGTVTVNTEGVYVYTPTNNYVGTDNFTYKVCDNGSPSLCDSATVYLTIFNQLCQSVNVKVLLEGAYKTNTGKMTTTLNQRGLLPGQTPVGSFGVATPAGQPYKGAPWNYGGTEGDTMTTYPSTVVDWVLVSLRSSPSNATPVWRCAGWLHEDGSITFPKNCIQVPLGSYYILVEHRNHLGVLSPTLVAIVNNTIQYDFTLTDSYITTNPPSFGSKVLTNGKWAMYSGDGMKTTTTANFDINFNDAQLWKGESGIFEQYRRGDFNLDADVNFSDQVLWKANNGRYSGVPH